MISFIVPAYNEEHELSTTLAAIRLAAEMVHADYEVVVVDDASTDRTPIIARQCGARLVAIHRRQIAAARNVGAAAARGGVLIFVDADTRIKAEHVSGAAEALARGYAGGGAQLCVDREIPRWGRIFFAVFTRLYFGLNLGAGAFLFTS